ncbi:MAG: SdrD B-like domain-containing protein [Prosthecobacter sp.]|uniref:SdrD B-like domain-containing protein n=1 Tax=Prosthecobacter sp. TaxID=1965333 RepID=UPI003903DB5F
MIALLATGSSAFATELSIGNLVFTDLNSNGVYDSATESGINGLTVELLNGGTHAVISTTTTQGDGSYSFSGLAAGSYKVRVTPNAPYPLATTAVNLDNGIDNDSNGTQSVSGQSAISPVITLTVNDEPGSGGATNVDNTIDFGFCPCATITVEPDTPATLTLTQGGEMSVLTFSASGGTGPYTWAVDGLLPEGLTLDADTGVITGTPTTLESATFTVTATGADGCQGSLAYTINVSANVCIGNLVFVDANNNGRFEPGESGVNGVTVQLLRDANGNGYLDAAEKTPYTSQVTAGGGLYQFNNLPTGTYWVFIPQSNFATGQPLASYRKSSLVTTYADNGVNNDDNGMQLGGDCTAVVSPRITISSGECDLTIDFGFAASTCYDVLATGSVTNDMKWLLREGGTPVVPTSIFDGTLFAGETLGGMAWGPDGQIYVTDTNSGAIYRHSAYNGERLATVVAAGVLPTPARFLSFGPDGHLYASLFQADKIVKINASTGAVIGDFVTAGSGSLDGPQDLLFSPDACYLYVASNLNDRVLRYNATTGAFVDIAFQTQASPSVMLDNPGTLAFGSDGYLYIDHFGASILRGDVNTGVIEYFAGAAAGVTGWEIIRFGPDCVLYAVSQSQHQLWKWNGSGWTLVIDDQVGSYPFHQLGDLLFRTCGSLSIGNQVWRDVDGNGSINGGNEFGIHSVGVQLWSPGANNAIGGGDDYLIASTTTDGLGFYNFHDLMPGKYFIRIPSPPSFALLSSGTTSTVDNQVDDNDNGTQAEQGGEVFSPVVTLTAGAEPTDNSTETGTGKTQDNDFDDSNGDLTIDFGFVPTACYDVLLANAIDPSSQVISTTAQGGGLTTFISTGLSASGVRGMAFGPDGHVYALDNTDGAIERFNVTTGAYLGAFTTGLPDCYDLVLGPDNHFYVTLRSGAKVVKVNGTTGAIIGDFVTASSGGLTNAQGLAFSPDGTALYVANSSRQVYQYNGATGAFVSIAINDTPGNYFLSTQDLAFGPDGALYISDYSSARVIRFDTTTSALSVFANASAFTSGSSRAITSIRFGPDGDLYALDAGERSVLRFSGLSGAALSRFQPADNNTRYRDILFRSCSAASTLSIGNLVFYDLNGNSTYDSGTDTGISGVTVELLDGNTHAIIANTTTNSAGAYLFSNLAAGTYKVRVTPSPTYPLASPSAGNDDGTNNNNDGSQPGGSGTASTSFAFDLIDGSEPGTAGSTSAELTIDFGFYPPPPAEFGIGNLVFIDQNHNGIADAGEGKDGVTVTLKDNLGNDIDSNSGAAGVQPTTTTTAGGGFYLFSSLPAGSYTVFIPAAEFQTGGDLEGILSLPGTGSDNGVDDASDENGTDATAPWSTGVTSGIITLGDIEPTSSESGLGGSSDDGAGDNLTDLTVDFGFIGGKATTFAGWQQQNPLDGQNGPTQDPDGDGVTNLEEFAFCYQPDSGLNGGCPLELVRNLDGTIDAEVRRVTNLSGITYQLEYLADLANSGANGAGWTTLTTLTPTITPGPGGTETATYANLASVPALSLGQGFVRIKVSGGATTARSEVAGWATRSLTTGCQTCNVPFLKCEVFAGAVDGVLGSSLNLTTSAGAGGDLAAQFTAEREYYVEVVAGDHAGQRFEINEATCTATSVAIDTNSPRNTLGTTIPTTLAGDRIVVREHQRLQELFAPADFTHTNSPATTDRLLFHNKLTGAFQVYWLYTNAPGSPQWVDTGDAALLDAGSRVVDVCEGLFVHPKGHPVTLVLSGYVRSNAMACPLVAGANLLGNGWPLVMNPTTRKLLPTDGFTGGNSSNVADRVQFWNQDDDPSASGYTGHFLLNAGALQQWSRTADASVVNENSTGLFQALRAHFAQPRSARPNYLIPNPWTP